MSLILDLNNMFLEVLNLSWIYPITSKVHFVKGLANYRTYDPNSRRHGLRMPKAHLAGLPREESRNVLARLERKNN